MVQKQCVDCGTEARPRLAHPSNLRTEITVWLVALGIGTGAGFWSIVSSPPDTPESRTLQRAALSVINTSETTTPSAATQPPVPGVARSDTEFEMVLWLRDLLFDFLRTAWWVLPVPLLFSLWRQVATREECIECRSRHLQPLAPVPDPF